ncbi:MAG: Gfo/Idh/MocA family oxidoreductase [Lachnospira sp.]|nr:Gfo/Idh/MocA family oxidoreductase [Lachnospira sp.]
MAEKIRVALVGVGVMGSKYADMIVSGEVKNMSLTGIVARKPEAREWANGLISTDGLKPTVYSDIDDMFANSDDYDAVIIVTPHKTHEEIAVRAFELGKHVLCDKPAGASVSQAERMTAAAKEHDKVYGMIFHQHRYPKYMHIKNALDNGELGELKRIMVVNSRYFRTAHYHKSGSWRSSWNGEGGGALINQGAHILDMWQWLFGMPQKLYADIPFGKYNDFKVDDEATVQMRYANGATGVFMLTTGEAVWQERLEIVGTKARMLLEDDTLHIYKYSMDSTEYIATQNVNSRENLSVEEEIIDFGKAKEPYVEMLENFADAVITGDKSILISPGEKAVNQLMLTNAAYYSAWKGVPVELPLDAAEYDEAFSKQCSME